MDASFYEILIRQAFQSGRNHKIGAEADIYRDMEHAYYDYSNIPAGRNNIKIENDFRSKFSAVRNYVSSALKKVHDQFKDSQNTDLAEKLASLNEELTLTFFDRERLDQIISEASDLLKRVDMLAI